MNLQMLQQFLNNLQHSPLHNYILLGRKHNLLHQLQKHRNYMLSYLDNLAFRTYHKHHHHQHQLNSFRHNRNLQQHQYHHKHHIRQLLMYQHKHHYSLLLQYSYHHNQSFLLQMYKNRRQYLLLQNSYTPMNPCNLKLDSIQLFPLNQRLIQQLPLLQMT